MEEILHHLTSSLSHYLQVVYITGAAGVRGLTYILLWIPLLRSNMFYTTPLNGGVAWSFWQLLLGISIISYLTFKIRAVFFPFQSHL